MKILLIPGSARPNSAGKEVVKLVSQQLEKTDAVEVDVAGQTIRDLPFYDNPNSPSSSQFTNDNPAVQDWSDQVTAADAVVFIMPEYNHSMTGLQKNAIDWLYSEWRDKPAAVVAYGFYGGKHAIDTFWAINDTIKTDLVSPIAKLTLGEHLAADGKAQDAAAVEAVISPTVDGLVAKLSS